MQKKTIFTCPSSFIGFFSNCKVPCCLQISTIPLGIVSKWQKFWQGHWASGLSLIKKLRKTIFYFCRAPFDVKILSSNIWSSPQPATPFLNMHDAIPLSQKPGRKQILQRQPFWGSGPGPKGPMVQTTCL